LGDEKKILMGGTIDVGSLILLEARPCAGESNAELVAGAWDFVEINGLYERHQVILDRRPHGILESEFSVTAFAAWLRDEREAWQAAMRCDPLLPEVLLPPDYRGCQAWRARLEAMREAAQQMRDFKPPRKQARQ
jgi:DNA-binding transcriptional regulator PaaX